AAPKCSRKPRELADALVGALPDNPQVAKVTVAGPGFVNIHLHPSAYHQAVKDILMLGDRYGEIDLGCGQRLLLEFVSANPTGPLHVGHGRGAAYGASLANVLRTAGYQVEREYYINDAGRQMDILAASVWLRYLEACGETLPFPANAYRGDYLLPIAHDLLAREGEALRQPSAKVLDGLPPDEPDGGDREVYIDAMVARARALLGESGYARVFNMGLEAILGDIRDDLAEFGVTYDRWYSERSLGSSGALESALQTLRESRHTEIREGALWFCATEFGDEKDRVVVRENGVPTYFAADIAYHLDKYRRGYDRIIDLWGADHHGYVPRVKAALAALGEDTDRLTVLLIQFAILYRGKQKVSMSTRAGEFVTLRELREEVGNDAARFFYVLRSHEQHLDFDLELAKSQSADNPVYYVQYAHARVCSVFNQLAERGEHFEPAAAELPKLDSTHERALMVMLARYPETIEVAARQHAPHHIAHYLRDLAQDFHAYYNAETFLVADSAVRNARLCLIASVRQVLRNGLALLGVSAPERM
ncbi:arginine--tRNA ligase, partial [Candidatus Macondimonas diazotrophica]|nr:arginine--tRNA ligase [Candidatus Macondimonas diazotrophica]